MEAQTPEPKQALKIYPYAVAWVAYIGALFTAASKLGDTVKSVFTSLHYPKKEDFYE